MLADSAIKRGQLPFSQLPPASSPVKNLSATMPKPQAITFAVVRSDGVRFEGDPPQIDVFAATNRAKPLGLDKRNQLCHVFAERLGMENN
ncbi:Core protein VP4 [Frankliniella fusca]|uniref:Core protein VP4 n=1 Tax=Frankliniella fusca TaxID=407009 RepID=A0AAE1H9C5_9NEOP|nr:Core protein VP4 [Frankliniella fusca]